MKTILLIQLAGLVAGKTCFAMDLAPTKPKEILHAIGKTDGLPKTLQRSLNPDNHFELLPAPKPGDWLAEHPEDGQTFDQFVDCDPNKPDVTRSKIYLQPLGTFPEGLSPSVEALRTYAATFFAMEVTVLPPLSAGGPSTRTRVNPYTGNRQILTTDILDLLRKRLPKDGFCTLAITMNDLYPDPWWNFVFGQASLRDRVGVFSFARYDPAFYGEKQGKDYKEILLRRSCKVLAHEMAHIFSLEHCIFFMCLMNGSNHLEESDARPLHLCPVCLRKLQLSIGFDVVERYRELLHFYRKVGFDHEARSVSNRLTTILDDENTK
jgi:archaemetzincin